LISSQTFNRLINNESVNSKTYTILEFFSDLQKSVWTELDTRASVDLYRRNLQKLYIDKMILYVDPPTSTPVKSTEFTAVVRAQLVTLRAKMRAALLVAPDNMTRYHLQDLVEKINNALSVK
jgi:hypothetical protein